MKNFVDPEFQVTSSLLLDSTLFIFHKAHQAIARVVGLAALTLTDVDLLPFNPTRYYEALVSLLGFTKSIAPESTNFSE